MKSMSDLAREYFPQGSSGRRSVSRRAAMRAMRQAIDKPYAHHLPLRTLLLRHGWKPRRRLPPHLLRLIYNRMGEP